MSTETTKDQNAGVGVHDEEEDEEDEGGEEEEVEEENEGNVDEGDEEVLEGGEWLGERRRRRWAWRCRGRRR